MDSRRQYTVGDAFNMIQGGTYVAAERACVEVCAHPFFGWTNHIIWEHKPHSWNISHHAGVHIVAVLWLALSLVGGGELEGVVLAAYANREGRACVHVLFV